VRFGKIERAIGGDLASAMRMEVDSR
jgi:hypothetical protein